MNDESLLKIFFTKFLLVTETTTLIAQNQAFEHLALQLVLGVGRRL